MTEDSKLTLTGLRSGYRFEALGAYGFKTTATSTAALGGYRLSTQAGKDGVPYTVIDLTASDNAGDPPGLELSAFYQQLVSYKEVDLDIKFADIPEGTEVEVESTNPTFAVPRQAIHGSSLIGVIGNDPGEFEMDLVLRLWIKAPGQLHKNSTLSLALSRIESEGGSDKKILLQKFAVNLFN